MDTQTDQVIKASVHDFAKVIVSLFNKHLDNAFSGLFTTRVVIGGCHWFFVTKK